MTLFSISQLGKFSGIKPHTIRAWEIRYNALKPTRSVRNTRYYDSSQMRRLLALASLVNAGYKASEVGCLPDERLEILLENTYKKDNSQTYRYLIHQLIVSGMSYDATSFEKIFEHCITHYQLKRTYQFVLLPMLDRIGLLWKCDRASPCQEHFVSNMIRQKLFAAADSLPSPTATSEKWLLFLPENEFHELGLLLAYNLIRFSGDQVIYLGTNVPWSALPGAVNEIRPDKILFFTRYQEIPKNTEAALKEFYEYSSGIKIYGAGVDNGISKSAIGRKIQWLTSVEELSEILHFD